MRTQPAFGLAWEQQRMIDSCFVQLPTPAEAWQLLESELQPLTREVVSLEDAAGRVLAQEIVATTPVPSEDVAALDGWAVAGDPLAAGRLRMVGDLRAGDAPGASLSPGTVLRIATGAAVPAGADRILPVELGSEVDGWVTATESVSFGHAIRRQAEVCRPGERILPAGTRLTPAALGLLASQGILEVTTFRLPRIALVVTGSEVVAPNLLPPPGKLRDAHSIGLQAQARAWGFDMELLGRVADEPQELRSVLSRGLEFDVLLTTGGVSEGAHDWVEPLLAELGARPRITGIAIQPGKPCYVGRTQPGTWIFGLPGNPVSAFVLLTLLVLPALDRLRGGTSRFWAGASLASTTQDLPAGKRRELFLAGELDVATPTWRVTPLPLKGSHDLVTLARANCLIRRPIGAPAVPSGESVEVLPLSHPGTMAEAYGNRTHLRRSPGKSGQRF